MKRRRIHNTAQNVITFDLFGNANYERKYERRAATARPGNGYFLRRSDQSAGIVKSHHFEFRFSFLHKMS